MKSLRLVSRQASFLRTYATRPTTFAVTKFVRRNQLEAQILAPSTVIIVLLFYHHAKTSADNLGELHLLFMRVPLFVPQRAL